MNQLNVNQQQTILTLRQQGWSNDYAMRFANT